MIRLIANAAVVLLAACAGFERRPDWYHPEQAPRANWPAEHVDPIDDAAIWGVGDSVTYAIDVDVAGTHHPYTFTLTIEQLPPPRPLAHLMPDPIRGRVLTTTARESFQWPPVLVLSYTGKASIRARLTGTDGTDCTAVFEQEALANFYQSSIGCDVWRGVDELFRSLLRVDCMLDHLLEVIRPPSFLSVASRLGSISVTMRLPQVMGIEVVEQDTPLGRLPTVWLPVTLDANGQPALDGRVQFTWKRSPLLLSVGVLQIEAWRPDDATRRITLRLVGARRGVPADAPGRDELGRGLRVGMTVDEVCATVSGTGWTTRERGQFEDGRAVEVLAFQAPHIALFGAFTEGRLLFASAGEGGMRVFLAHRGFAAESPAGRR